MTAKHWPQLVVAVALVGGATVLAATPPAGALEVSTEAALRAAFGDPTEAAIVLTADIDLLDCAEGDLDRVALSVDLEISGEHTLRQTCDGERILEGENPTELGRLTIGGVTFTGGRLYEPDDPRTGAQEIARGGAIKWPGSLVLDGVTVTGNVATGEAGASGGGIWAGRGLTMTRSTVTDNRAASTMKNLGQGGGVAVDSIARVSESTIAGNVAEAGPVGGQDPVGGRGGGIVAGIALIDRTTVVDNQALGRDGLVRATQEGGLYGGATGGGIYGFTTVTLTNSTVVDNAATGAGSEAGGVTAQFGMSIAYSTLTGNDATWGSNIGRFDAANQLGSLFGSVVADPRGGGLNCGTPSDPVSQGFNVVTDTSCNLGGPGDRQGPLDLELGPLGDHGGFTSTRLPAVTSPLVGSIPAESCLTPVPAQIDSVVAVGFVTWTIAEDQRGVPRPQGGGCTVGAVEIAPPAPSPSVVTVVAVPRFTG